MNVKKLFAAIPVAAAMCLFASVCTAFAEDNAADDFAEEDVMTEEVPITYGIRRGEGFYEGAVIYQDGIDCVYDDDGNAYTLIGGVSGNLKEGETRESVEQKETAYIKQVFTDIGKDPNGYAFDLYLYFYDDYDYSPEEFLDFVAEDSLARGSGNASPNPPTGTKTAVPFAVSALLASCAALAAIGKKES